MAEVLPPVRQSAPISLSQTLPDHFQSAAPSRPHSLQQHLPGMARPVIYTGQGGMPQYRATSAAPVAPYAFQSTPHLRQENRTISAPSGKLQQFSVGNIPARLGPSNASSISTNSTRSSSSSNSLAGRALASKDDLAVPTGSGKIYTTNARPLSTINLATSSTPDLSLGLVQSSHDVREGFSAKPTASRYRRSQIKVESNRDSLLLPQATPLPESPSRTTPTAEKDGNAAFVLPRLDLPSSDAGRPEHIRKVSDDGSVRQGPSEQAKRYRRRSAANLNTTDVLEASGAAAPITSGAIVDNTSGSQVSIENRTGSSAGPRLSKAKEPEKTWAQVAARPLTEARDSFQTANANTMRSSARPITPRTTSQGRRPASPLRPAEAPTQRAAKPSPLSRPMQQEDHAATKLDSPTLSPAALQLQALSDKDGSKNMKSRLRRAFSFGSSAELRRASAQNNIDRERAKLQKQPTDDAALDAKLAAEVAAQEAAGLGNSIYSQGQITGSTDNLSLASTASSASMMLRKMGKGMKKSARSVKGLFRPKSVIGVPAADEPVAARASAAQVSMITVEAERERVNVNLHPNDRAQGETDFPHLERNSLDAGTTADHVADIRSRKSIVGGDAERDEVLRAVRKGILKRSGTGTSSAASSPVVLAVDTDSAFGLTRLSNSPLGSGPQTPIADDASATGAQKTQSLNIRHDYFGNSKNMTGSTRSLPVSPAQSRNIAWNPRIQFHDVWSPTEYDRRGDIATCNRLTPMLAQQIKEELNTFKMEMEVHELSKPHTHFF